MKMHAIVIIIIIIIIIKIIKILILITTIIIMHSFIYCNITYVSRCVDNYYPECICI